MSKKSRLVLHIGMHKTGTKSIQFFFVMNRLVLRLLGIDYPKAFGATGGRFLQHNDLFHAISHEKNFAKPHPILGSSAGLVADLAQRVRAGRTTVISAEGLSGESPAFAQAFALLRNQLDVRVVCFLRRQDDWVQSFYGQMVRSREVRQTREFGEFLQMQNVQDHLDYAKILGWWADSLGTEAIRVEVYTPQTRVLSSFLQAAGLPKALALLPFSNSVRNRGLNPRMVEKIRAANREGMPGSLPAATDRTAVYFTPDSRRDFMRAFESGNEAIRATFRPDLKRLFI